MSLLVVRGLASADGWADKKKEDREKGTRFATDGCSRQGVFLLFSFSFKRPRSTITVSAANKRDSQDCLTAHPDSGVYCHNVNNDAMQADRSNLPT
ncbi:hypothetical protein NXS19_005763 [Fusarium pseudograminearum]|nr:hypothetical protein NXS19_005763 [Fusarium pseudograminearum]